MVTKKSWKEFRNSGMLWFVNMILHTFGWSIVCNIENDEIVEVYPARVKFRGFSQQLNTEGYIKMSQYMKENAETLLEESKG